MDQVLMEEQQARIDAEATAARAVASSDANNSKVSLLASRCSVLQRALRGVLNSTKNLSNYGRAKWWVEGHQALKRVQLIETMENREPIKHPYTIDPNGKWIRHDAPGCGIASYNTNDIEHKFCSICDTQLDGS